jgi:hypothetical protein
MIAKRLPDWVSRFDGALAEAAQRPFAYGVHDCGLFACAMVRAVTGVDPAEGLRGAYHDKASLADRLREEGGSLEACAERRFAACGLDEIPVARATRGDLLLGRFGGDVSLGVVALDGRVGLTAAAGGGVVSRPLRAEKNKVGDGAWLRAWRVG